jgi:hypothetical protein
MSGRWQAAAIFTLVPAVCVAEPTGAFDWEPLAIRSSVFSGKVDMLDSERDEYATNLANYAARRVVQAKASPASMEDARRMLALALHLSPRNRRAVVVNFQLGQGLLPDPGEGDFSPQVFARLIITRSQILEKQGGIENTMLARIFTQVAAELDPRNEDAVYLSELQRLDHGSVDWSVLTRPKSAVSGPEESTGPAVTAENPSSDAAGN